MLHDELLDSLIESNETFVFNLKEFLREKGISIMKFCEMSKIPESTLYKIMSDPTKDFRISTLRDIIRTVRTIDGYEGDGVTIGIITTRQALDMLSRTIHIEGKEIKIKEYPANTIEEEIIQGVRAEREGVRGIICGPIAASTMEKIVNIPVISFHFEERLLMDAIRNVSKKI